MDSIKFICLTNIDQMLGRCINCVLHVTCLCPTLASRFPYWYMHTLNLLLALSFLDSVMTLRVTLDSSGCLTYEAERKLEEVTSFYAYCGSALVRIGMGKPKKKKSLRKKEKLDLDALEVEAVSARLGVGDLGSRKDGRRQASREEQEKIEAGMRKNAYQLAYAKAEEASRLLRVEQTLPVKTENDENMVVADDDEDLYKSLERARKLALKKQEEEGASGPKEIALHASSIPSAHNAENQSVVIGESQESRVVMTEIEGFVSGLEVDEVSHKPDTEDVFMDEDEADNEV
ncbi:hypothetical protein EUGRSUZ_G01007 [Eucalyptus grandis]|uniref:Uncharacterized protein n=2 Tax=Eucalyptus grandis TaxID=71139 RepID=A0ACC3K1V3_EUCGR|nr:hypothetical protein EUGRSUZ_G01007 [Eucalyptus grandis]